MGVSGFWPFLRKNYPDAFKSISLDSKNAKIGNLGDSKKKRKMFETDIVCIDLNSLVHHCFDDKKGFQIDFEPNEWAYTKLRTSIMTS